MSFHLHNAEALYLVLEDVDDGRLTESLQNSPQELAHILGSHWSEGSFEELVKNDWVNGGSVATLTISGEILLAQLYNELKLTNSA